MIGCFCCVGYRLKGQQLGDAQGILVGNSCCVGCPPERENDGVVQGGQMGGKVAKIEFFKVGNRVENGHLSADKVTKISDKVFVLKKTFTQFASALPPMSRCSRIGGVATGQVSTKKEPRAVHDELLWALFCFLYYSSIRGAASSPGRTSARNESLF